MAKINQLSCGHSYHSKCKGTKLKPTTTSQCQICIKSKELNEQSNEETIYIPIEVLVKENDDDVLNQFNDTSLQQLIRETLREYNM